ncbi:hypothetical protein GCM10010869_06290 [Mesorhizobium tianshanense]|uniref:Helix-turn-helix protein n=1 Tax=Mesorhizobium tianshanense TaxID=39844 RepID=A0A562NLL0_9HYPH|nr:helix-turn-helix transcriptional regulator [Mesorhizobium tianshanense]TWI33092.1 helix-turn-helix protein [Mesorhizobium tianshanense]GLS35041.1 hypothetical protein GCM10010869_06290 [Mesorhizobium tianshanense]
MYDKDITTIEVLPLAILTELPRHRTSEAVPILDVIEVWLCRQYSGNQIQDAIEFLRKEGLLCTDDDNSPPVYPRCSVLFSSSIGDTLVKRRGEEFPTVPDRFVEGLKRLKALRGWKNKDLAKHLGVSEAYMSEMMRGIRDVKLSMLDRLKKSLGVTTLDLFGPETRPEVQQRQAY